MAENEIRLVICGDDSLLGHAEQSEQPDVVNIWSTLYKAYRKAHDLIALGITIGAKEDGCFSPFELNFGGNPACENRRVPNEWLRHFCD